MPKVAYTTYKQMFFSNEPSFSHSFQNRLIEIIPVFIIK